MITEYTGKMVLLVDDEPTNLGFLVDALDENGLNVAVAKSGEEAIGLIGKVNPDIILLDVIMPGIDGFETCRRLNEQMTSCDIPVIFMTALAETVEKVRGFESGGVDYVTKPFHVEEVLARIDAHLAIRDLRQQLREEIAAKDTFFSIMAHDVKNSLIGFLSFAKLLEHFGELDIAQIDTLTRQFRESTENLLALLDNLLTWSRMQRGQMTCVPQEFLLDVLIARNLELMTPAAEQKRVDLRSSGQKDMLVYADMQMFDTILRNLLSNAIKFTHSGGMVEIQTLQTEQGLSVIVSDTGIGIPEDILPSLFDITGSNQRQGTSGEKGTGLGLILCKEFMEQQGGTIAVRSNVGKGTSVTVTLPCLLSPGGARSHKQLPGRLLERFPQ